MAGRVSGRAVVAGLALAGLGFAVQHGARRPEVPRAAAASGLLDTRVPIEPFSAVDLDGHDRSPATWGGRTVIVNFWATWCPPCRREIPALAELQRDYGDRLLVLGVLQDDVTVEFVRTFGESVTLNYPVVASTFEIEQRFPPVVALPMTFIVDGSGRLAAMYAGEIDPAVVRRDVEALIRSSR